MLASDPGRAARMYTKYRLAYTEAPLTACSFQPGCRLHLPSVLGVGIAAVGMAAATYGLGFLITCASFSAASRSASASAAASAAASSLYEPRAADPSAVSPSCATSGASVRARRPDDCGCHQLGSRLAGLHANHQPSLPAWGVDGRESAPQKQRRPHDRPPRLPTSLRFRFGRSAGYHSRCAPLHVRVPGLNLASLSE